MIEVVSCRCHRKVAESVCDLLQNHGFPVSLRIVLMPAFIIRTGNHVLWQKKLLQRIPSAERIVALLPIVE